MQPEGVSVDYTDYAAPATVIQRRQRRRSGAVTRIAAAIRGFLASGTVIRKKRCNKFIRLSKKLGATKRTEHFLRWFHHFRWIVLQRYGVVHSISDPEMLSDILTKCVNAAKFHLCAKGLRGA